MVVYFSGTGNSRYCAQMLADLLDDEVLDVFHYIRDGVAADLRSGKPWVFVSPTYAWRLPRIFQEWICAGQFEGSKEAYFVMTCGVDIGNAERTNRAICGEKGLLYKGTLEVVMPENYVAMFPVPDEAESAKIIAAARPVVEAGAAAIQAGGTLGEKRITLLDRLKSGPVNPAFYRLIVKAKKFYSTQACVGCGRCVACCPANNVELREGRPVWGDRCTHCMACICGCPTKAIEYGRASRGKPRYQCQPYKKL